MRAVLACSLWFLLTPHVDAGVFPPAAPALDQDGVLLAPGNLGIAGSIQSLQDGVLVASRFEGGPTGGVDLNGDGDTDDTVPYLLRTVNGVELTVPLAGVPGERLAGESQTLLLGASEFGQGADLNGDGDALDFPVSQILDVRTGALDNTGLSLRATPVPDLLLTRLLESEVGADLTGDGDLTDIVLATYVPSTGTTTSLGLGVGFSDWAFVGRQLVIAVLESLQSVDLDGDGDLDDRVLHVWDPLTGLVTNSGVPIALPAADWVVSGDQLIVSVAETHYGQDLDGDGTLEGTAVSVFDPATTAVTPTELVWGFYPPQWMQAVDDELYLALRDHDVVLDNHTLHRIDVPSGAATSLGLALGQFYETRPLALRDRLAALLVSEDAGDLNGDGDAEDLVLHLLDLDTDRTRNLGLAGFQGSVAFQEGLLTALIRESDQFALDLNDDGDAEDNVATLIDVDSGRRLVLPVASGPVTLTDTLLSYLVPELSQGAEDLNGDGDLFDNVLTVTDLRDGTTTALGAVFTGPFQEGRTISFAVSESGIGNVDLNGDGDTLDQVLHLVQF